MAEKADNVYECNSRSNHYPNYLMLQDNNDEPMLTCVSLSINTK